MYIETSSPRQQGDNAKLNSPKLQFSGSMCLKFYYHMYGANIATLNVIINGNKVFTASGNKGNEWLRAAIDVSLSGQHAVRDIIMPLESALFTPIHRKKKDGGCTFYHNTLRTKLSPLGI